MKTAGSPPCGITNPRQVFNLAAVRAFPDGQPDGFHADERFSGIRGLPTN
jgi:hypothetical protein